MASENSNPPRPSVRTRVQARVEDICETLAGEWLTLDGIMVEYTDRFGPVEAESIRKSMHRLSASTSSPLEGRLIETEIPGVTSLEVRFTWAARLERIDQAAVPPIEDLAG